MPQMEFLEMNYKSPPCLILIPSNKFSVTDSVLLALCVMLELSMEGVSGLNKIHHHHTLTPSINLSPLCHMRAQSYSKTRGITVIICQNCDFTNSLHLKEWGYFFHMSATKADENKRCLSNLLSFYMFLGPCTHASAILVCVCSTPG